MKKQFGWIIYLLAVLGFLLVAASQPPSPLLQTGDSDPPGRIVKLVFIHHSTGENWLTDGYGNLGKTLNNNNYFVSDTNYGWGPDGIGDRTDIPDWLEWFQGGNSGEYLEALFNESEQHSSFTRTLDDPGGENQIIMFKSCFPNSNLEGNPDDPPTPEGWLTVGHAKYVYNQILETFQAHPDKLFVVITAPPLSEPTHADNARAFNLWLVEDWLTENQYPLNNVVVFDFYNVLTGPDGHHTFREGEVIHQAASKNTLHYPSGDDHPSHQGSRKATDEFIPLLNYYYHRWESQAPISTEPDSEPDQAAAESAGPVMELSGLIDDFEGAVPAGSTGWQAYWDESTASSLTCEIMEAAGLSGGGLQLGYQIAPSSWGTCGLYFDQAQNWSGKKGLSFMVRADHPGKVLDVDLYVEGSDGQESYIYQVESNSAMVDDWTQINLPWEQFKRVDWEADAGTPFAKPDQIAGLAFGFSAEEEGNQGTFWIDNLGWLEKSPELMPDADEDVQERIAEADQEERPEWNIPCIGSLVAFPLGLIGVVLLGQREITNKADR